jgi:putative FmdB family regulatory protein
MITFDYHCKDCELTFTFLQKDHEKRSSPQTCPVCGAKKPTRLITPVRTKSFYGPAHPRHRRGLTHSPPAPSLPTYSKEDLE